MLMREKCETINVESRLTVDPLAPGIPSVPGFPCTDRTMDQSTKTYFNVKMSESESLRVIMMTDEPMLQQVQEIPEYQPLRVVPVVPQLHDFQSVQLLPDGTQQSFH